ncbi:MAG: cyclic lactone autoinducer peptide [Bacilli bacterium]|nr:cyclic lactone autoinducer peptide [Bacilli bacterium]
MKLFASVAAFLGALVAATASAGCIIVFVDEPEMPESLL